MAMNEPHTVQTSSRVLVICGMWKVICRIAIAEDCWLAKWAYHMMPFQQITRQKAVFWKPQSTIY